MTALIRKVALKKVEFIAFIVQTINLSCSSFTFFCLDFVFVLNMHYMWFKEGQDLATEAVELSLFSDGLSRK